ncbi:MAG: VCBS repeat-containing protein [Thermoguttaceae bacterium]|nr:VCBS repeat-containing protein [Thermoguttaceae bacterium]
MKKHSVSRSSRSHSFRSMRMEPLEGRILLAVGDWQGFENFPERNVYESGSAIVDFEENVDLIGAADLNHDGFDDLIAVNKADSTVSVYLKDAAGGYGAAKTTAIDKNLSQVDIAAALGDFNGDGKFDLLVADTSSTQNIVFSLYSWSNGSFSLTKTSDPISLSVFAPSATVFLPWSVEVVQIDGGAAVRMQAKVPGVSTSDCDRIVLFSCSAAGSFTATTGSPYGTVNGEGLVGSLTEGGHSFLVTVNKGAGRTCFNAYDVSVSYGKASFAYAVQSWNYTAGTAISMTEPLGAVASGQNLYYCNTKKLVSLTLSLDEAARTGSFGDASAVAFSGFSSSTRSVAMASGAFASVSSTDLIAVSGTDYVFFNATGGESPFSPVSLVTQPDYFASWEGDYNGDGSLDLLVAGASGIWLFADSDLSAQPIQLGNLNGTASSAVFGYFGTGTAGMKDDKIDVAVLYEGKVGIFYQGVDGRFTPEGVVSEGSCTVTFESVPSTAYTTLIASGDVLGKTDASPADQIVVGFYHTAQGSEQSGLYLSVIDPLQEVGAMIVSNRCVESQFTSSHELTALWVGALCAGSDPYADVLYTVCRTGNAASTIVVLDNTTGSVDAAVRKTISAVPRGQYVFLYNPYQPVSVACGDINGDGLTDIVFLSKGTGALDAAIGYVLQTGEGFSTVTYVLNTSGSGEAGGNNHRPDEGFPGDNPPVTLNGGIDQIGEVGGLTLGDINGDGKLDAVFTVNNAGRSKFYWALGKDGDSRFNLPVYNTLAGDDADGVNFQGTDGELLAAPYLLVSAADRGTGEPSVYAVKGKTVLRLDPSYEKDTEGTMTVVIRGLNGTVASAAMTVDQIKDQNFVYDWLDEWSSFYVEIWGAPSTSSTITQFSAELSFRAGYYVYSDVEAGTGFTVTADDSTAGKVTVSGFAGTPVTVASGKQVLLARVKMAPVEGGGIFLDDLANVGVFQAFTNSETFNLLVSKDSQSINQSNGVNTVTESLNTTTYFPVRFDVNDDGAVDDADLAFFLKYYAQRPVGKYKILLVDTNPGATTISDYDLSYFLAGYGWSYDGIRGVSYRTGGFYKDAGFDPYLLGWTVRPNSIVSSALESDCFVVSAFERPSAAAQSSPSDAVIVEALDALRDDAVPAALAAVPFAAESDRTDWLFDFEEDAAVEEKIDSELLDYDIPVMD